MPGDPDATEEEILAQTRKQGHVVELVTPAKLPWILLASTTAR